MGKEILTTRIAIDDVQLRHVLKLYVGEEGCRCGCNGTYYYPKSVQAEGTEDRGYAVDDDEVADDSVFVEALIEMTQHKDALESDLSTYTKSVSTCSVATKDGGFFNLPKSGRNVITVYLRRS